ncbi:NAD(P)H-dependent flavin oxidoreductase, partial [Sulfitobacter sp.]|uniref:NAD(P)H-dependent flavin oxidoreductase n=1 Tax=Sulfitobacter sp. TaxID=1903071 RepID=UPI003562947B
DTQIKQCLDLGVTAFSFFWDVLPDVVARVKREDALVLHQVGTTEQARKAENAGADVIIAQGIEAGGHVHGRMGSYALAETILQRTKLPVVLSGGISTGKGLASALALGAQGVQCGTAFLATNESFAHSDHKQRVVDASGDDTVLTDVFVLNWPKGAAVRVVGNSITAALDGKLLGHDPDKLPRDAIAWDEGQERYRFSTDSPLRTTTGDLEAMPNYAGQGAGLIGDIIPTRIRIEQMITEAVSCLDGGTVPSKKSHK